MSTDYAPIVTDLTHQAIPTEPLRTYELAEQMRPFAGPDFDALVERLWAARDAIDQTMTDLDRGTVPSGLLEMDATQVAAAFRTACQSRAAIMTDAVGYTPAGRMHTAFMDALESAAREAMKPSADIVVANLRKDFTAHVKVIAAAHKAGLTKDTGRTELLTTGTPEEIAAFRDLPAAVAGLEQIANLRNSMAATLRYDGHDPALSFVTGITDAMGLQGAIDAYADSVAWAQYNQEFVGSTMVRVRDQHLGGRWLALMVSGYTLHLNTAAEVQAVIDTARKAD